MADPLHQRRVGATGEFADERIAGIAILGSHFHLDQHVVFKRILDLGYQCGADALAADLQDRLEAVRMTAEETGLGIGQGDRHMQQDG